ncbi:MAG: hypothetical protein SaNoV_gp4 [Sanya Nora-like virus]|nr:MAG: hypothetical protein SaNoV_gp4 [Sanya Nora-like virus]
MSLSKSNLTQGGEALSISVLDHPYRTRVGLSTLTEEQILDSMDRGNLVSEVGFPQIYRIGTYDPPIPAFNLRQPRKNKVPSFIGGSVKLGDTLSAARPQFYQVPAVGSSIIIPPWLSRAQATMFDNLGVFGSVDFLWIVHIPSPLGTALYLQIYAPEVDATTETRGIRYKPQSCTSVAFACPWSNDLALVDSNARPGQSGGSIVIKNLADNTTEDVVTPLNMTVWCIATNLVRTGWDLDDGIVIKPQFRFSAINVPKPLATSSNRHYDLDFDEDPGVVDLLVNHADNGGGNEVNAEGSMEVSSVPEAAEPSNPIAPPAEKLAAPPKKPSAKSGRNKDPLGSLNTKWYNLSDITLGLTDYKVQHVQTIDPYNLSSKGQAFNLPWRKHVWTSGTRIKGVVHTCVVQINIARSPQVSGVLEIINSKDKFGYVYNVQFGEKIEVPLIPDVFTGATRTRPRYYTQPWIKTSEASCSFRYRLIAFNRSSAIKSVTIRVAIRPGFSLFQNPIKPRARGVSALAVRMGRLMAEYESLPEEAKFRTQQKLVEVKEVDSDSETEVEKLINQSDTDANPSLAITAVAAQEDVAEALHDELGEHEDLDLDDFPVASDYITLTEGQTAYYDFNLPAIVDAQAEAENSITQKFSRMAHIIPTRTGPYGPVVGSYTIEARLPTDVAATVEHVCLPGDMNTESALRIFGLGSILGMAGSALAGLGGPLIRGIINTVPNIIGGIGQALGGDPIGGLVSAGTSLINNIVGGVDDSTQQEQEPQVTNSPSDAVGGDIPVSRFVEMLKPILENYSKDPVLPTLVMKLAQVFTKDDTSSTTRAPKKIQVRVFSTLKGAKVERNCWNRTYDPSEQFKRNTRSVGIPSEDFGVILTAFDLHPKSYEEGTTQNKYYKLFVKQLTDNLRSSPNDMIYVSDLDAPQATLRVAESSIQDLIKDMIVAMETLHTKVRESKAFRTSRE